MKNFVFILLLGIALISCESDRDIDFELNPKPSEETSAADGFYNHIFAVALEEINDAEEDAGINKTWQTSNIDPCADIEYYLSSDQSYVESLTITYDDDQCYYNGRKRLGKINVHLTGKLSQFTTVMTITLENFFIGPFKVEGTQTISNKGFGPNNTLVIQQIVTDGKVKSPNGDFFTWESTKDISVYLSSNVVKYTGTANGITSNNQLFNMEIIEPLITTDDCGYVKAGVIEVNTSGIPTQEIDYGDGACDNKAIISSNGQDIEIELK